MGIMVFTDLRDRWASSNMSFSTLQILCNTQMKNMGEVENQGPRPPNPMRLRVVNGDEGDEYFDPPSDASNVVTNERGTRFVIPPATDPEVIPKVGRRGTPLFTRSAH